MRGLQLKIVRLASMVLVSQSGRVAKGLVLPREAFCQVGQETVGRTIRVRIVCL